MSLAVALVPAVGVGPHCGQKEAAMGNHCGLGGLDNHPSSPGLGAWSEEEKTPVQETANALILQEGRLLAV